MGHIWTLTKVVAMVDAHRIENRYSLICYDANTKEHIHHYGLFNSIDDVNCFCIANDIAFQCLPMPSVREMSHSSVG